MRSITKSIYATRIAEQLYMRPKKHHDSFPGETAPIAVLEENKEQNERKQTLVNDLQQVSVASKCLTRRYAPLIN